MSWNKPFVAVAFYSKELEDKLINEEKEGRPDHISILDVFYLWVTGTKFTHCEIVYHKGGSDNVPEKVAAYTCIVGKGTVCLERSFSKPTYEITYLDLSEEKIREVISICRKYAKKKVEYDIKHMKRSYYFPVSESDGMWCTKLVSVVLQDAGLIPDHFNPNALTTDELYDLIHKYCKVGNLPPFTYINKLKKIINS
jgi:hypothetical protein